jgi:hypothetical protein
MESRFDRRVAVAAGWLLLGLAGAGCRNCDAVEAELRIRDQQNQALHSRLRQAELNNMVLQRELYEQRTVLPPGPGASSWQLQAPPTVTGSTVQRVTLGRLTGGHSGGSGSGDDSLEVVLEPRDSGDRVLKAAGSLQVSALEITPEGVKRPIGTWDMSADQLASKWRSGLFGSAYNLILPWQQSPATTQVRIVVRFTSDGKTFEAERDVAIRLGARPNVPPEKANESQGPILSRVFSFWKKDRTANTPPREEGTPVPVIQAGAPPATEPAATWQPAEHLPPVRTRLLSPIPLPDSP